MIVYPHSTPIIMTDAIFQAYGGDLTKGTPSQRAAAYLIAEKQATKEIGTFLLPTIVTGTFPAPYGDFLGLPYSYVHRVLGVSFLDQNSCYDCNLTANAGCAFIWEDEYGYVDVRRTYSICGCGDGLYGYQVRVSWQAGLPTGTASSADVLLALTIVSDINLNEIIDGGANEGVGDVGVIKFSNQEYSEDRKELRNTSFGNSARANKAAQLVRHLKRRRGLRL